MTDFHATTAISADAVVWSVPREELAERLPGAPLLVIMHGYGSHEADLISLAPYFPAEIVCASLRAPLVAPAPIRNGFAWFGLADPSNPSPSEADAAARGVLAFLDGLTARFGAPGRVSALGFSQGGAMALHLLRHAPERFVSAVNLSGFSVASEAPGDATLERRRPPVFWGRDENDPVIPPSAVVRTAQWLAEHASVDARLYGGIQHGIAGAEIGDVRGFLEQTLLAPGAGALVSENR